MVSGGGVDAPDHRKRSELTLKSSGKWERRARGWDLVGTPRSRGDGTDLKEIKDRLSTNRACRQKVEGRGGERRRLLEGTRAVRGGEKTYTSPP